MHELGHVRLSNIAACTKNMCAGLAVATNDLSAAFTIYHTGGPSASATAAGTAVTTATIAFDSGDDFVFTINGAADARLGTAGKVDASSETGTFDTLGELADKVNAVSGWAMRLEGGIRADTIDSTTRLVVLQAAVDCFRKAVTFYWDSSVAEMQNFVISNRRIVTLGADDHDKGKIYMIEDEGGATNVLDYLKVNFDVTGALTLYLYSINGLNNVETLLGTQILPDASAETYDFTKCGGLSALVGERLVGRIVCATDLGATTEFRCVGRSIGGRWAA